MFAIRSILACVTVLALASCSGGPLGGTTTVAPVDVSQLEPMRVASFTVTVPESLSVSEENSYDPRADIVWRADPPGSRYSQVQAVMEAGIRAGTDDLDGTLPVALNIVVQRFHSQTQKVRYSFGGDYEVHYDLEVRDARNGSVVIPAYRVYAVEDAPGGNAALAADLQGRTEKMDNIDLIARSIRTQLTTGPAAEG